MSLLLAYMGNDPQRIRCALHPGRSRMVDPGVGVDGWGLGFYQGGEVLLQRRPMPPSGPLDFYELVRDVRTEALIGHMRSGTVGVPKNENTHPFRFRSWLFAHHGTLAGFAERREAVLALVPDFLRRNLRGQTDSEHLFHLVLAQLHQAGKLDDPMVSPRAVAPAIREALAAWDRTAGEEAAAGSTINLALTNGRLLLATRRGRPLRFYRIHGLRDCPVCRDAPAEPVVPERGVDHEHLRAVAMVTNGADTVRPAPGVTWEEVPDRSLVTVSHELQVEIGPLG